MDTRNRQAQSAQLIGGWVFLQPKKLPGQIHDCCFADVQSVETIGGGTRACMDFQCFAIPARL